MVASRLPRLGPMTQMEKGAMASGHRSSVSFDRTSVAAAGEPMAFFKKSRHIRNYCSCFSLTHSEDIFF
jgi:hypothetical protein